MAADRKPAPTHEELRRWTALIDAAERHARDMLDWRRGHPEPVADRLNRARRACRRSVMPVSQQVRGSALNQLFRLAERWPAIPFRERLVEAVELRTLALAARAMMAAAEPGEDADASLGRREPRKDIFG